MGTKQTVNSSHTVPSSIQLPPDSDHHNSVVVYYTSLRAVRPTFNDGRTVLSILQVLDVAIDKCDVHVVDGFREELQRIFRRQNVPLPSVFVHGKYIGGAEDVKRMCDSGELLELIEGLPKSQVKNCGRCGGSRAVVCDECNGSHRVYREKSGFGSCSSCNADGLIRCPACFVHPHRTKKDETKVAQKIVDATKNKLHMQSKDIDSDKIEENHVFGPYCTPNSGSEPISSQKSVYSKSQSSPSNQQPPGSEFTSSRKFGSLPKEAPDLLLKALENYDKYRFNSTILKELSEKLQDDSINKIGLYGKGGSGKTTLLEVVHEKLKNLKIFDAVFFVTGSPQNPNGWKIQKQIAKSLELNFGSKCEFERATKISSALSSMNRILVILDDVPTKFDPGKCMGIHCNDKRCKFLFTTCSKHYFFGLGEQEIRCQNMIPMRPLSPEGAWRLLQEHSGIEDDDESSSKLLSMAKEITVKNKWWPGKIKKIGSSLKDKPLEEWEGLLDSLRHSSACYQIFLSFRGEDTRHDFTSYLYAELKSKGFKTFMDDKLKVGDQISEKLLKAIENSRLSIIVLSKNYADSAWCLDELVHILECKKNKKQLVWPIFYKVKPTDVRHQTGAFGKAWVKLEEKFKNDTKKINKWKDALFGVCELTGRRYKAGISQHQFIQEIIESANESKNYLYIRSMDMD